MPSRDIAEPARSGGVEIVADAVLFDNDGVLVDSHAQTELAWRRLAAEFDLDVETLLVELVGVRAADTLGRYLDGDRLTAAVDRLEDLEVELAPLTEAGGGAADLLARLPDDRWTVVTSATRRLAVARWRGAALPLSPTAVSAEDVSRGKPDPEPFLVGAERLGADPSRCVVFEDSPSGGRAALAAGATVVAVGDQPWPIEPAVRIVDLSAVRVVELSPVTVAERAEGPVALRCVPA
ncbi:MAG: HAD-IA family hydrolase [Actinomycetota bacterium]